MSDLPVSPADPPDPMARYGGPWITFLEAGDPGILRPIYGCGVCGVLVWDRVRHNDTCPYPRPAVPAANVTGVGMIAAERIRQAALGYTPEHDDDTYTDTVLEGSLAKAGAAYAMASYGGVQAAEWWPWDPESFHPTGSLRDLAKAGALIAAEIDRRLRSGEQE